MSTNLQHTSIRASAGTGKTYQLANRYIALLLLQEMGGGKASPEKIVAMTFTRKGAGEFAERILHRLAAAAGDADQRKRLQTDLARLVRGDELLGIPGLAPGMDITVGESALQSTLAVMIDQLDRLVLGTIDGFMARSVQTLAFELGLGGFELLEEAAIEREREELLREVFQSLSVENLENFFQILKRATLKSSSGLRKALDGFVKGYHKLLHALPEADAWGGSSFWDGPVPNQPNPQWQADAAALVGQVATYDFGHKQVGKSLVAVLEWLASRNPGSAAGKIPPWLDQGGKLADLCGAWPKQDWSFEYYRKLRTVPASIMTPLKSILDAWLAAECAALSRKTSAIHEIVARYEEVYDRLARRKGRLTFDDLPLLLDENQGAEHTKAALISLAFRWYQKFDHWLLDEFQDTSRVQWGVLKPWLDEAIQDNTGLKSVFVVGDSKQSIYGWRGGEPRLFDDLASGYPGAFKEQIMAESWRSRPAVLELVNRVCSPDTNPALLNPDQFSSAALKRWKYDHHFPEENRGSKPGYAAVLLTAEAEAGEGEMADTEAEASGGLADKLAAPAQVIKTILEKVQPLEKGLTCAILVRKNANAQAVAQWLRAHGVPQVMVEGVATLAEQSPIVAALVDALRWLAVPANTLAAGHISATPLWEVLLQPLKEANAADVPPGAVWRHWRARVADVGGPQITHEWCAALAAVQRDPYAQYCLRHISQSAKQAGAALALPDWIAALEQLTVRETAAAGSIHVMTIHKAKGLGFDVVFLPDLDSASGGSDDILIRQDAQGCATGCLSFPPKWLQVWEPKLGALCAAQKAEQDLEALCVLYVALTRSKEATFVILNKEKPRRASPARDWILSAVGAPPQSDETPWNPGQLQWESGSREFSAGKTDEKATVAPAQPPTQLIPPIPRLQRRKPSEVGHDSFTQPSGAAGAGGGQEFGTAVHEVFEQIEWWTPNRPLEGDESAVALVRRCMAVPEIRTLFARDTLRDEAFRELPVEFMEKNAWWSGVIDRLVLRRNTDGSLRRVVLIDFKTDRVETGTVLRERYSKQLAIYRQAIIAALKLADNQVEAVLLSSHLETLLRI